MESDVVEEEVGCIRLDEVLDRHAGGRVPFGLQRLPVGGVRQHDAGGRGCSRERSVAVSGDDPDVDPNVRPVPSPARPTHRGVLRPCARSWLGGQGLARPIDADGVDECLVVECVLARCDGRRLEVGLLDDGLARTSGTQIWIGRSPWARRRSRCARTRAADCELFDGSPMPLMSHVAVGERHFRKREVVLSARILPAVWQVGQ